MFLYDNEIKIIDVSLFLSVSLSLSLSFSFSFFFNSLSLFLSFSLSLSFSFLLWIVFASSSLHPFLFSIYDFCSFFFIWKLHLTEKNWKKFQLQIASLTRFICRCITWILIEWFNRRNCLTKIFLYYFTHIQKTLFRFRGNCQKKYLGRNGNFWSKLRNE